MLPAQRSRRTERQHSVQREALEGNLGYRAVVEKIMIENHAPSTPATWPELAEGLYSFLTGRGTTIEYSFDNMEVMVPSSTHPETPTAKWRMNGTLRVRTHEHK